MPYFGIPIRNGVPIGLGSVAGFGTLPAEFTPASLFTGGVQGAWYDPSDSTTLFSDRAGTTPCAAPGAGALVPVGAMLDERAPGYSVYFDGTGDYLSIARNSSFFPVANEDFTFEAWAYLTATPGATSAQIVGAQEYGVDSDWVLGVDSSRQTFFYLQSVGTTFTYTTSVLTLNSWNHIAVARFGTGSNNLTIYVNGVGQSFTTNATTVGNGNRNLTIGADQNGDESNLTGYLSNVRVVKGTAVYTGNFTPPTGPLSPITGTSLLTCGTSWSGNPAITKNGDARVDGLNPFQASPVGNHAIAANDTTARPELSARVNLLTKTEQFEDAVWAPVNSTITANQTTAPNGTSTADLYSSNATNGQHYIFTNNALISAAITSGVTYVWSIYLKKGNGATAPNIIQLSFATSAWASGYVNFNISTGAKLTEFGYTGSISDAGNGWWRCSITATATATTITSALGGVIFTNNNDSLGRIPSYVDATTSNVYIWGADLRPANIGTTIPAYQRVADQYTYDNVGFPRYLAFNGTSSAMSTPASIPFATVTSDGQARRNLLTNPTQFDVTASWTASSVTISANTTTAPDGTSTADTMTGAAGSAFKSVYAGSLTNSGTNTFSIYVKSSTQRYFQISRSGNATDYANFDIQSPQATAYGVTTASIVDAGSGWYRLIVTFPSLSNSSMFLGYADSLAFARQDVTTSTNAAFIWGAQLETGSTATAFQNIGTDKATVFAGVRKLSDAIQVYTELSANYNSNNGTFLLWSNETTNNSWYFDSKGTIIISAKDPAISAAPASFVLTGQGNISAPSDTLRKNGTQVASNSGSQGTGNFGSYPLYIGSRNNASFFLNGSIYSLIVVGAASSASQISSTESWVSGKVGGAY